MCKKRNSVMWNGKRVDSCMRNGLNRLQKFYKTLACCCGHGVYPETIIIQTESGEIREYFSRTNIPQRKRFYKKDKDGFYYIPEVYGEKR